MESWSIGISVLALAASLFSVFRTWKLQNVQEQQLNKEAPDIEVISASRHRDWVTYTIRNNYKRTVRGDIEKLEPGRNEVALGSGFLSLKRGATWTFSVRDGDMGSGQPRDVTFAYRRGEFGRKLKSTRQLPDAD